MKTYITKHISLFFTIIVLNSLFFFQNTFPQWVQTNGPMGGTVYSLVKNGTTIFAGTYPNGLYKSTNQGQTWIQTSLNDQYITALAVSNSNIFAASDNGIYKSTDNGSNWTNSSLNISNVSALTVNDSNIYVGSWGLFLSTNTGNTWIQVLSNVRILSIIVNGQNIFAGANFGVLYHSTNNGQTWSNYNLCYSSVSSLTFNNSTILAGTLGDGIYISSNNGQNWQHTSLNYGNVESFAINGPNIFAGIWVSATGQFNSVYLSTDNGLTWAQTSLTNQWHIFTILIDSLNLYAGTNINGLYISSNNGQLWTHNPYNGNWISSLAVNGSNIFAGTEYNGVFRTTNYGQTWQQTFLNGEALNFQNTFSLSSSSNYIYAGTYFGIYASSNNGDNWSQIGLNDKHVYSVIGIGPNIFAGTEAHGLYLSTNNGETWNQTSLVNYVTVNSLALNDSNLYAGTSGSYLNSGVYRSNDLGRSWIRTSLTRDVFYTLGSNEFGIVAGSSDSGVYISTNKGDNWTHTVFDSTNVQSVAINESNIFAGTSAGVYITTNFGATWFNKNEGLGKFLIQTFLFTDEKLFIGTWGSSVWKRNLSEIISIENIHNKIPKNFILFQNFPNPFNPATKIKFSLPNPSKGGALDTKLIIYDALGREVAILVNERLNPGTYETDWDATNYSSGIYFYKLVAGDFTAVKKMILLK